MNLENKGLLLGIREWYERAKIKAEEIIKEIDDNLRVEVSDVTVTPKGAVGKNYDTVALKFRNIQEPNIRWTMAIEPSDDYLNNRFKKAILRIYQDQKGVN